MTDEIEREEARQRAIDLEKRLKRDHRDVDGEVDQQEISRKDSIQ